MPTTGPGRVRGYAARYLRFTDHATGVRSDAVADRLRTSAYGTALLSKDRRDFHPHERSRSAGRKEVRCGAADGDHR
jgi:hypothetical protein